jgi:hypothetical protein
LEDCRDRLDSWVTWLDLEWSGRVIFASHHSKHVR